MVRVIFCSALHRPGSDGSPSQLAILPPCHTPLTPGSAEGAGRAESGSVLIGTFDVVAHAHSANSRILTSAPRMAGRNPRIPRSSRIGEPRHGAGVPESRGEWFRPSR